MGFGVPGYSRPLPEDGEWCKRRLFSDLSLGSRVLNNDEPSPFLCMWLILDWSPSYLLAPCLPFVFVSYCFAKSRFLVTTSIKYSCDLVNESSSNYVFWIGWEIMYHDFSQLSLGYTSRLGILFSLVSCLSGNLEGGLISWLVWVWQSRTRCQVWHQIWLAGGDDVANFGGRALTVRWTCSKKWAKALFNLQLKVTLTIARNGF